MESFLILLGLAAMYSWVHFTVVFFKKAQKLTSYETAMSIFAIVTCFLYILSTLQ